MKFEEYEKQLPLKLFKEVEEESKKNKLTAEQTKKVFELTKRAYENSLMVPGEGIGVVTAESFGEPSTQMVLWTFHFAGVAELSVMQGLPRLIEILDARQSPKTPRMEVYLKSKYTKDEKVIRRIASKIKETTLNEISSEFSINILKGSVEVSLDEKKVKDFAFNRKEILDKLTESFKNVEIKATTRGFMLKPKEDNLRETYKLKEKVKDTIIRGIKGISQVLPMRKDGELIIVCAGTNLKDVVKVPEVDAKRTTSNDIHEIKRVLGVEAARQAIIKESLSVIENQGLDIDIRHIMFLADLMTNGGTVKGVTRGGITGEKESVLARATFETPITHIINASLIGERDNLNSVIENVIVNQPIPIGTGLPGLIAKMKEK